LDGALICRRLFFIVVNGSPAGPFDTARAVFFFKLISLGGFLSPPRSSLLMDVSLCSTDSPPSRGLIKLLCDLTMLAPLLTLSSSPVVLEFCMSFPGRFADDRGRGILAKYGYCLLWLPSTRSVLVFEMEAFEAVLCNERPILLSFRFWLVLLDVVVCRSTLTVAGVRML
jgi:hypothetical protein